MIGNDYHCDLINVPLENLSIFSSGALPTSIRFCWIIHEERKCILSLALNTQSKHLVNQIATCLLAPNLCVCSFADSAGRRLFFPFQVTSSHMAPSLDTITNIFHDNASVNFHLPVRVQCVHWVCACSLPGEVSSCCSHSYQTVVHNLSSYE